MIILSTGLVALGLSGAAPVAGTLFVSGYTPNAVFRYDAVSGEFIDTLDAEGGITGPLGATRGPDGRIYVASELTNSVLRFEADSGEFVDAFVAPGTGGLTEPASVVFGPDRNADDADDLYVSSFDGDSVLTFDGLDGSFIDVFVTSGSGGLNGPDAGMTFGPDGHLFVPSFWSNRVIRYDGASGALIDVFVPAGRGGMARPRTIVFRPDGHMLVTCESADRVVLYDGTTGDLIDVLIDVDSPTGMTLDATGHLYVASIGDAAVYRYDGATGALDDVVVSSGEGGLSTPTFVLLVEACGADLDGSGAVDFGDILAVLSAWGPCPPECPEDLDGNDAVDFGDLLVVLAEWGACP